VPGAAVPFPPTNTALFSVVLAISQPTYTQARAIFLV